LGNASSKSGAFLCFSFRTVVSNLGAIYNIQGCRELILYQYAVSLKNTYSNCHQTLKQIAMGSPLGAAYCVYFLSGAASLKGWEPLI